MADALEAERAVQDAHALRLTQAVLVAMLDDSKDGRAGSPSPAAHTEAAKVHQQSDPVRSQQARFTCLRPVLSMSKARAELFLS